MWEPQGRKDVFCHPEGWPGLQGRMKAAEGELERLDQADLANFAVAPALHTSGIFIHTFEIKSNLILISNPIMAYAYQKQRKT